MVPSQGDDGRVYVDCEEGKQVAVIDPSTQAKTFTYDLGFTPGMAREAPDGKTLWVTEGDNKEVALEKIPVASANPEKVTTGAGAHGIAFSADGKTAYVTNQMAGTLSVINVDTHEVKTVQVGQKPNGLVYRAK